MNLRFMKWIPFTIGVTCAMVQGHCESDLNSRVSQLETDMKKVRCQTAFDNCGAKTAAAFPQIDGFGFFATGEFLWWKLYEFQTDYVFSQRPGTTDFKGNVHSMDFHWNPGFRLGLGYIFDCSGWDVCADFTDYETRADKKRKAHKGGDLFSLWGSPFTPGDEMRAKWHMHFYEIDLLLGRNYFVSKSLSLHPNFGLTTAWIHQRRKMNLSSDTFRYKIHGKDHFWGIGTRLGLDTQFFLGRNFSLYANVYGALLWGNFKVRENYDTASFDLNNKTRTSRMSPTADINLGIAYETNLNCNKNHICIKVGYENQYWWRQNQFPVFPTAAAGQPSGASFTISDDLGMQGLTLDVRVDF